MAVAPFIPLWARSGARGFGSDMPALSGDDIALWIGESLFSVGGRSGRGIMIDSFYPECDVPERQYE